MFPVLPVSERDLRATKTAPNTCPICRVALYQKGEGEADENEQENNEDDEEEEEEPEDTEWENNEGEVELGIVDVPTFLGPIEGRYHFSPHHSNHHLLEDVNNQDLAESFIIAFWDTMGDLNGSTDLYDENIEVAIHRATECMERNRIILKVDMLKLIAVGKEMAEDHYNLKNRASYDIGRPDILAYWVERVGDVTGWPEFS